MPKLSQSDIIILLEDTFNKLFQSNKFSTFFAPGRVNLIGEHIDYNGGYVFPVALDIGTYIAISPREDNQLRFYSLNFIDKGIISSSIDQKIKDPQLSWTNYSIGVINSFAKKKYKLSTGFNVIVYGNIPDGAGLSSSASIGVVLAYAINKLYNFNLDNIQIAQIAQEAEHFAGVNCGIMDQFISSMGKEDHAILLNCSSLDYTYVPFLLEDYSLIIMDSQKQRKLNESKYNERRFECEKALKYLQKEFSYKNLGEFSEEEFFQNIYLIPDVVLRKRAKHVITENQRTLNSLELLKKGNIKGFGINLNNSHYSLCNDYEVTGFELDTLTDIAREFPNVLGSRMTGAGFGGCGIALIPKNSEVEFITYVGNNYTKKTNLQANFYLSSIGNGVHQLV